MSMAMNDGYEYMIQRKDGRIVFGGMRWRSPTQEKETIDDTETSSIVGDALHEFLIETFPELSKENLRVEYNWTGIMGYTIDSNPLIGPLSDNEFVAAGYTGHGMPQCFGAGKAIAEMIAGVLKPEDFIQAFLPSRLKCVDDLPLESPL